MNRKNDLKVTFRDRRRIPLLILNHLINFTPPEIVLNTVIILLILF